MLIYDGDEVIAMISLREMEKFVDHDVFNTPERLLGEFEVS
jgi:hypothetical protein